MTGRALFKKYAKGITLITKLIAILPKRFRRRRLETIRNKSGSFAMLRRYILVKTLAKKCGDNVAIFPGVYFEHIDNLEIGENVSIHQMCYIDAEGGISIGNNVSIAHRSTILSSNHNYFDEEIPIKYQGMNLAKTVIDENVWVGCGCVILAGVTINHGSIVGANSTVTHNISSNIVVGGCPAKKIKDRVRKDMK